jgi:uncharacterized RDD family membrane protein YckC
MALNPYAAPSADVNTGFAAAEAALAGRGARLGAALLDSLVIMVVPVIALMATGGSKDPSPIGLLIAGVWFLGVAIYQIVLLSSRGQTLGKKWLGIKIVRMDGGPVSFGSAFLLRYLVGQGLMGIIPFYGLVDPLFIFREDRRCVHDMVASTKVVEAS